MNKDDLELFKRVANPPMKEAIVIVWNRKIPSQRYSIRNTVFKKHLEMVDLKNPKSWAAFSTGKKDYTLLYGNCKKDWGDLNIDSILNFIALKINEYQSIEKKVKQAFDNGGATRKSTSLFMNGGVFVLTDAPGHIDLLKFFHSSHNSSMLNFSDLEESKLCCISSGEFK